MDERFGDFLLTLAWGFRMTFLVSRDLTLDSMLELLTCTGGWP